MKNAVWEQDYLPPKLTSSPTLVKREEAGYLLCCDVITYCLVSTCSATGRCFQRRHCKPSSLSTRCGKIQVRITLKLQFSIHRKVLFSSPPSSPLLPSLPHFFPSLSPLSLSPLSPLPLSPLPLSPLPPPSTGMLLDTLGPTSAWDALWEKMEQTLKQLR